MEMDDVHYLLESNKSTNMYSNLFDANKAVTRDCKYNSHYIKHRNRYISTVILWKPLENIDILT